jgi:antitoxin component YwqK of YwqJK toxin-antitoxin module
MKIKKLLSIIVISILIIYACNDPNNGVQEEYNTNGTIKSQITLKNGLRNGISKLYDERGRLTSTAEYINDKHEGWVINYNPDNGKVMSKALYKNDMQNGPVTLFYREGYLYREMNYINDMVDGIVKTYWPNGKIQAENLFKMGNPAIGLKEFDSDGKPINEPYLVINEINQLRLLNKLIIKISISDGAKKVEFFMDDLKDGKYLNPSSYRLRNLDGVATIEYSVPRGGTFMKKLSIIARLRTELGNTLVLQRAYNVAASN